jgi:hypothetical protein
LKTSLVSFWLIFGYVRVIKSIYPVNAMVSTGDVAEYETVGNLTACERWSILSFPNDEIDTFSV